MDDSSFDTPETITSGASDIERDYPEGFGRSSEEALTPGDAQRLDDEIGIGGADAIGGLAGDAYSDDS